MFSNFMLTVIFIKGIGPETSVTFLLCGTGISLVLFCLVCLIFQCKEYSLLSLP